MPKCNKLNWINNCKIASKTTTTITLANEKILNRNVTKSQGRSPKNKTVAGEKENIPSDTRSSNHKSIVLKAFLCVPTQEKTFQLTGGTFCITQFLYVIFIYRCKHPICFKISVIVIVRTSKVIWYCVITKGCFAKTITLVETHLYVINLLLHLFLLSN